MSAVFHLIFYKAPGRAPPVILRFLIALAQRFGPAYALSSASFVIGLSSRIISLTAATLLVVVPASFSVEKGRTALSGHVPRATARLTAKGRLPATNHLQLSIGLPTRNKPAMDDLLQQLYDPQSTNFHMFLTPAEFTARFGPTEEDYQMVMDFARANGLTVADTHPNRVVLDVEGSVTDVERAFHVALRAYRHPTEPRDFFAPDTEPSVPDNLSVVTVEGLSDYGLPKPLSRKIDPLTLRPQSGSGPSGLYAGNDFRKAYVPGTTLNGSGQTVGLLEFSAYFPSDVTNYENTVGMTNYVPLTTVSIGHPGASTANNVEVALDVEVAIAMAPGLSRVYVYEIRSGPSSILSRMANDNLAKQLSSSWTWTLGPSTTIDDILKQMILQGQSFFQASGDDDAYTGTQALDNASQTTAPLDSTNLTCVGGTTLAMNGSGDSWASETVWNYAQFGGANANVGSGGGISLYYTIPYWQAGVSMANNSGSTTFRNTPDVALTADGIYAAYNNGGSGGVAGTSCAAPLWAGFCALVNQQAMATSGTNVGFLNPALYAIAGGGSYLNCFHDITTGNNIGVNVPGLFNAVAGYDLCTGLGTPNGTNLIDALAPRAPYFLAEPGSRNATNGTSLTLNAIALGATPLSYRWLLNGTNLPASGNISGVTSNILSITAATTNNSGGYQIVASNSFGAVTSGVAVLSVGLPPTFSVQPTSVTVLAGSNATFGASASGSLPLIYQWRKNGTNLANGGGISGATTNTLALTGVTTNSSGNYSLLVTNSFGVATSSVAILTVVLPPVIVGSLTNKTIECGSNATFGATVSGTSPLSYQWSLGGVPVAGATNPSLSLTNVHVPSNIVTLSVTNPYASTISNVLLTVHDTIAPLIGLNGTNLVYIELGTSFSDPGATANDACAGPVSVVVSGGVNTNAVGTNTLVYSAGDGNGNTNATTRTVIVRDTAPPTIVWAFTNLTLAAGSNCAASTPDVTGTNFVMATDSSGALTISQNPTNGSALPLGTNLIVIAAADASGNTAYVTNSITVLDESPPLILSQPQSQTNVVGSTAMFSVGVFACTPLAYQWFFNGTILTNETNSTLTLTPVSLASSGDYSAVISASGGSSTSAIATLTVVLQTAVVGIASSENPSGYKDGVQFVASVSPTNAAGTVSFFTNGVVFDSQTVLVGQALSTNIFDLPRGTNLIGIAYSGDANDLPATNSFEQIVTNHPPTAAAAAYTRIAGSVLNIAVADLATNWNDLDGDTISLTDIGVSTNGVVVTNNAGMLVYSNSNDVADQFICTLIDSWGGTNSETVNITVTQPANPTPTINTIVANPDGSFSLEASGAPGDTYVFETTTDLAPPAAWLQMATNTLGTNGLWQITDGQATNFQQRFYRLKLAE